MAKLTQEEKEQVRYRLINYNSIEVLADRILELQDRLDDIEECIKYYGVEDEDCGILYNVEEKEILNIIHGVNK